MERGNKREVGIFLALLWLMGRGSEPTGVPVGARKIKATPGAKRSAAASTPPRL
jgi:hypothetical protein